MTETLNSTVVRLLRAIPSMFVILAITVALHATPATAQGGTSTGGSPTDPETFTLMPGDALQVGIWREPELSGEFIIDERGQVTLPLLGTRPATGIPMDDLRAQLLDAYRLELRNPSITIRPLRRIYVLGEVNRPGLQALDPTLSLAGAVALAGGASPLGDLRRLTIIRGGEELATDVGPEVDLVAIDIRSGDQIFVGRRSWLERNAPFVASTVLGVAGIIVAIVR